MTVESEGCDGRPVTIQLKDDDAARKSADFVLRAAEQQKAELAFEAKGPGAHHLTVDLPALPEEDDPLQANNVDVTFFRIDDEAPKVLLLAGRPQWEFRFVKDAQRRDPGAAGRLAQEPDIVLEADRKRRTPEAQAAAGRPRPA